MTQITEKRKTWCNSNSKAIAVHSVFPSLVSTVTFYLLLLSVPLPSTIGPGRTDADAVRGPSAVTDSAQQTDTVLLYQSKNGD